MTKNFELHFEIDVPTPYKRHQKEQAISNLINQLLKTGCESAIVKDSYYIDRKSAESIHSFVLILQIVSPILAIAAAALAIKRELKDGKQKGFVFLKDDKGKFIKIDENMTLDEVREKLDESKEES